VNIPWAKCKSTAGKIYRDSGLNVKGEQAKCKRTFG